MESKNVLLIFNKKIMYKPLIYRLAKDFDVVFNVLEAKILPKLEGRLILELRGTEESINASIDAKAGLALSLRLAAAARSNRSVSPVCTIPSFSCPPDLNVASFTGLTPCFPMKYMIKKNIDKQQKNV